MSSPGAPAPDLPTLAKAVRAINQEFSLPEGPLGAGVSINFICDDAIAIYHEFREKGLDPSRPFVGNHMWVTKLADPDGYALYFESATDAFTSAGRPETAWRGP